VIKTVILSTKIFFLFVFTRLLKIFTTKLLLIFKISQQFLFLHPTKYANLHNLVFKQSSQLPNNTVFYLLNYNNFLNYPLKIKTVFNVINKCHSLTINTLWIGCESKLSFFLFFQFHRFCAMDDSPLQGPPGDDDLTIPRAAMNKLIKELCPNMRVATESR